MLQKWARLVLTVDFRFKSFFFFEKPLFESQRCKASTQLLTEINELSSG